MPVLFKMSDDKKTEDTPTVVFTETPAAVPPRKTKKYVIIAVSGILAAAIILAAILVGMYMFTQAQKEIIQYTMQLSDKTKQDVTSDPNENVVQYHVSSPSHEAWIVNDFNKDIQLVKIVSEGKTDCYVSALNRTNAMDPSKISGPDTTELKEAVSLMYRVSDTPIADSSFLGKTAREMCKGISVYWLYPYCSNGNVNKAANETNLGDPKTKRDIHPGTYAKRDIHPGTYAKRDIHPGTYAKRDIHPGTYAKRDIHPPYYTRRKREAPYYCQSSVLYRSPYNGQYYWVGCVTGCCKKVCACNINYSYWVSNGQIQCSWTFSGCPPEIPDDLVYYDSSCRGPSGVNCPNANHDCGGCS